MTYAEVLLPLPLTGFFTYKVPDMMAEAIRPGCRVVVPFGRTKFYTGIVAGLTPRRPEGFETKEISQLLDSEPIVRHPQMKFWEWIADYYLCSQGEVFRAAVPAGLKLESETVVEVNPDFEEDPGYRLSERDLLVMNAVRRVPKKATLAAVARETGFRNTSAIVARLVERDALMVSENLVERYKTRKIEMVEMAIERGDSAALHAAFDSVKGAPKQEKALLTLIELSGFMRQGSDLCEVTRADLLDRSGVTSPIIIALENKGIVRRRKKEVSRFAPVSKATMPMPELTDSQREARDAIIKSWGEKDITLLHGVTSSGKTEVYISLIDRMLRSGRQVLYLVPEIALTTQLTTRLQRVFGPKVIIYHSRFSDSERVELWRRLLTTHEPLVVLGARSALFMPFASLGLIIVDEEHESSFKQQDPAPRYNARDAAMVLAGMHGAKTLLGSATPAVDTYYKALTGRFGLVSLTERYGGSELPRVEIVDMAKARKKREVSGAFSLQLRRLINDAASADRQTILFLNRRGFAPMARCKMCGYVPKCENCDVSLTYHHGIDRLVCHYCGTPYDLPRVCPACREPGLEIIGYGTERIEEEIAASFPDIPVARLDRDTTRNKDDYERIIDEFSAGKDKMLVGTQMVTKGLDFGRVSVVGVINADATINQPDFRSAERAFNMLEQVAGRAGRRGDDGVVAIQTYTPSHPLFGFLVSHDYVGFYNHEIEERRLYNYPPFTRIINIYLKHREQGRLHVLAGAYGRRLRELFGNRVFGPEEPHVARIKQMHIMRIMIKIETEASMKKVKHILRETYLEMDAARALNGAQVYYDVDPM
ncbi:primosomal protein N' [Prevotella sp. CAG:1031]|nr:primosomal protein N' [Prevotella sp. CAG:1031]